MIDYKKKSKGSRLGNWLLITAGVNVKGEQKPLNTALETFGGIVIAVDAPSEFAIPGQRIRDTERAAHGNYNTPDKGTFFERAASSKETRVSPLRVVAEG